VTWPFALHARPSRRPRAVLHGSEVARRRARAQARTPPGRRIFSLCPCSPPPRRCARFLQPMGGVRGSASSAGIPSRSSTALTWVLRSRPLCPPSARPASRLLRACLAMRCPGSGPSVRSSGSRCGPSRRRRRGSPLVCPSRPPVANLPSPSEPARGEPVDRRDFCCCRTILRDPTPHSLPIRVLGRAWSKGEAPSAEGRENVESRQTEGDGVGILSSCRSAGRVLTLPRVAEVSAGIRFHRLGAPAGRSSHPPRDFTD
jgi:hypothetical protein